MNRPYTLNRQRSIFPPIFPSNFLSGLGMLHTCLEARQVVLKAFYVLPSVRDRGPRGLNLARSLYFNPEVDTLYFVAPDDLRDCVVRRDYGNHARDRRIRRIAVAVRYTQGTLNIALVFIVVWESNYSSAEAFFGSLPNFQSSKLFMKGHTNFSNRLACVSRSSWYLVVDKGLFKA
jgi:hypothetical protein